MNNDNTKNIKQQVRYVLKSASKLLTDQQINVLSGSNIIPYKIKKILKEVSRADRFFITNDLYI